MRNVQKPQESNSGMEVTHPAYGVVTVGRISGRTYLFDSESEHINFIRIELHEAIIIRSNLNDRIHPGKLIASFDISEAQWAHFVSSHSLGAGTPVTLCWTRTGESGDYVPELPKPTTKTDKFAADMNEHLAGVFTRLENLEGAVQRATSLRKGEAENIRLGLAMLRQQLESNIPFVAERFEESMEESMLKAKIEIEAHFMNRAREVGLNPATETPPLSLADPKDSRPRHLFVEGQIMDRCDFRMPPVDDSDFALCYRTRAEHAIDKQQP